jgi:hypothetical protein
MTGGGSQVVISAHIGWGHEVGEPCSYFQKYWDKLTVELQTLFKGKMQPIPSTSEHYRPLLLI